MALDGHEIVLQVTVRVWVTVRKVNGVVVVLKADVEGQRVGATIVFIVVQWTANRLEIGIRNQCIIKNLHQGVDDFMGTMR